MKHRQSAAEHLKSNFNPNVPLTIDWDGKILEDITGKEKVYRLTILVSGQGVNQLLAVPKLPGGNGIAAAGAVHTSLVLWGLSDSIKAISFNTTLVNTEWLNGPM